MLPGHCSFAACATWLRSLISATCFSCCSFLAAAVFALRAWAFHCRQAGGQWAGGGSVSHGALAEGRALLGAMQPTGHSSALQLLQRVSCRTSSDEGLALICSRFAQPRWKALRPLVVGTSDRLRVWCGSVFLGAFAVALAVLLLLATAAVEFHRANAACGPTTPTAAASCSRLLEAGAALETRCAASLRLSMRLLPKRCILHRCPSSDSRQWLGAEEQRQAAIDRWMSAQKRQGRIGIARLRRCA